MCQKGLRLITISDVGEFGLIAAVTARLPQHSAVLLGPGDDAAVVAAPDRRVVASTDLLVEGRHFRRDWLSGYDLGRRAAAQNLADVVAMGAVPTALLVGLACPGSLPLAWAEALADGLAAECALVGASVVGGDVVGADAVTLAVTALGDLQGRRPVTRGGARPGDVVVLAGRLGWSAAGLALLGAGFRDGSLVDAFRRPEPPYAAGPALATVGATAMIDVSDGLLADLGHIAEASRVAIVLDPTRFDLGPELAAAAGVLGVDALAWVLTGGEDHALAATVPAVDVLPPGWRRIGRVADGAGVSVRGWQRPPSLAAGHDHFR